MLWSESSIVGKTSLSTITWSMRHCSLQTAFAIIAKFIPSSECRWTRISLLIPCCRGGRYGWSLLAVLATFEYGNPKGPSHGFEGQWMYLRASKVNLNVVPLNRHVHLRVLSQQLVTQSWLLQTYGNKLHDHRLLVKYGWCWHSAFYHNSWVCRTWIEEIK